MMTARIFPPSTRIARCVLAAGISLGIALPVHARIYVYIDPTGNRLVTDQPVDRPGYRVLHAQQTVHDIGNVLAGRQDSASDAGVSPQDYDTYILTASEKYQLDPALVKAVIHAESNFNPMAVSPKGARGLMQLMPETAARYNEYDLFSPLSNITVGSRHLSYLMERYAHNETLALAAYNAGEDNVDRYRGIPPFRETRLYVKRVMQYHVHYRRNLTAHIAGI